MAIQNPIVLRMKSFDDLKDVVIGADPAEITAEEMGIVIQSSDYSEKTQTCVGVLGQCVDQVLTLLKEYRGAVYFNVSMALPDGGNVIFNDVDTTVPADSCAVIVGNLFGQNNVAGVGGAALLSQQSHNIDKCFKQLIAALLESEITTPDAPANVLPVFDIIKAVGDIGDPAIVRLSGTPAKIGDSIEIQSTVDTVGAQGFLEVLQRGYTTSELATAIAEFARGWSDVTVFVDSSSNPNIRDILFEPYNNGVSLTIDSAVYTSI